MKALLRPLFVGAVSIAIAGTSLVGSSGIALAATKPSFVSLSVTTPVNEGDKPVVDGTFTDVDPADQHTVQIFWGDGSTDFYTLPVGDRSFSLQKSIAFPDNYASLTTQVMLADPVFSVSRFLNLTVQNVAPSVNAFGLSRTDLVAGDSVTASGGFDDPGTADTHTVTVSWGDGSANTVVSLARRVWTFTTSAHTYLSGGTFEVTATIADDDGGSAVATSSVTVAGGNEAPSVVSLAATAGNEGGSSSLSLTFSDADAADTHTVAVAWGDGATSDPVSLAAGVSTFDAWHVYADTGTYAVTVTLADNAGHSVTAGTSVSPANVAPTVGALALGPAGVVDHQTATLTGTFADPGTADTFTLTVSWGDGTTPSQLDLAAATRTFSVDHAYSAAGPYTITATVVDRDSGSGHATLDVVVSQSNRGPESLVLGATATTEGTSTTLTVSFTDADSGDAHNVAVAWGDGSSETLALGAGVTTAGPTHAYLASGTYAVSVTVTDAGGLSVSGGASANVVNVAPSLGALSVSPSTVVDGQTVATSGTFTDPGTADTFSLVVDWGDGSTTAQSLTAGTRSFSASHAYASPGAYTVIATVTDSDGGVGSQSASLEVRRHNTGPSSFTLTPNVTGSTATVTGSFTDPDAADTHSVTVTWGDGQSATLSLAAGVTSFDATHTYAAAGTYTVNATVTDPSTASASASRQVVIQGASSNVNELLDQLAALIRSYDLDRNTERWLLKKVEDIRQSLASGSGQACTDLKTLDHLAAFAGRVLSTDQYAGVSALVHQIEAAAGCRTTGAQTNGDRKTTPIAATTTTPAPAPKVVTPEKKNDDNNNQNERNKAKPTAKRSGGRNDR
jgi:PKD repeat protein